MPLASKAYPRTIEVSADLPEALRTFFLKLVEVVPPSSIERFQTNGPTSALIGFLTEEAFALAQDFGTTQVEEGLVTSSTVFGGRITKFKLLRVPPVVKVDELRTLFHPFGNLKGVFPETYPERKFGIPGIRTGNLFCQVALIDSKVFPSRLDFECGPYSLVLSPDQWATRRRKPSLPQARQPAPHPSPLTVQPSTSTDFPALPPPAAPQEPPTGFPSLEGSAGAAEPLLVSQASGNRRVPPAEPRSSLAEDLSLSSLDSPDEEAPEESIAPLPDQTHEAIPIAPLPAHPEEDSPFAPLPAQPQEDLPTNTYSLRKPSKGHKKKVVS